MPDTNVEKLMSLRQGVTLCWLGNLSWLIRDRYQLIAFDLDLDRADRIQPSPIPTETLAPLLDVHLITHGHEDHFNSATSRILIERSDCLFVVPANCVEKARKLGITESRLHVAHPGQPFDLSAMHIEPQRALHGHLYSSVYRHANLEDCGYLFTLGGKRFLQPGDTVLLHDHLDLVDIDVLFVSPTVHNMYVDRAAILINALEPEHIFAQHFGTYEQTDENRFWTKGYPDELKSVLSRPMQARFHKPEQGQIYTVE